MEVRISMEQDTARSRYDDDRVHSDVNSPQTQRQLPPPGVMPGQTIPHMPPQPQQAHPVPPAHGPAHAPQQYPQHPQPQYTVPPRRKRRFTGSNCLLYALALLVGGGILFTVVTVAIIAILWNSFNRTLTERLDQIVPQQANTFQTTRIYDRTGNELWQVFDEGRRTRIRLSEVSPHVIDATIAVEDASFYENPGIDLQAIGRAGLNYFFGTEAGGASSITQQLVRNIAFDYEYRTERSARRKIEEALLALVMTREYSKDAILEMYLNTIYYGNVAYGIEAAAQTYFGKNARDLTLGEASLLAGLPQSPANLDPFNPDPTVQEAVLARRRVVLDLMVQRGKITRAQAEAALSEPLVFANPNVNLRSPHFTLYAQDELRSLLPAINLPEAYMTTGGLSVYTTLDADVQALIERVARAQIDSIRAQHNANNAAVVVLHPATGEILAMLGSVNYYDDSIDGRVNVATSPRQPGSSIKPLTYALAMEQGNSPAHVLWDVEIHFGDPSTGQAYSPVNYDRRFHGPVRMRDALANSYNIPAVEMLRQVGVENLLAFAERLGIRSLGRDASRFGLSLTLGGGEVTLLELTQAYSVFANGGRLNPATSILCILDGDGNVLYEYERGCQGRGQPLAQSISMGAPATPVLDERIAFVIGDILGDNAARSPAMGANSPLRTDGIASSVKTGTTDNFRDNWTVGYTQNVVVGVWVGNTDAAEMQGTTGLTGAAPIWNQVITSLYSDPGLFSRLEPARSDEVIAPVGLRRGQLCDLNAVTEPNMSPDCAPGRSEWLFDSPPLAPDENGNLAQSGADYAPTPLPVNGPLIENLDPGVIRAVVHRLDPNLAMMLASANPVAYAGGMAVPPTYCLVPNEVVAQVPSAMPQVFIEAPPFPDEDAYARMYAAAAGLAIAPRDACTPEMLASGGGYAPGVTAQITAPRPGETTYGTVFVMGTAAWSPGQAQGYKMEIIGPQFPNWTTFAGPFGTPVMNSELGNFGGAGLAPGTYQIRIVIIGMDSNNLYESPPVPINISGS
ncbi:MAG: transglycosylase domain-containing protein [Anaerolineae bacterium]|nr:transglycosylase domain-containing protein [Anaerolineae bacterium]